MRVLIITQTLDRESPTLGFFHYWVAEFERHWGPLTVICLQRGTVALPNTVRVLSLGKEEGVGRLRYLSRFVRYLWREREGYDTVFVHMNQEYLLLAGWWWRLTNKKVFLWRNHYAGSLLTRVAALFCHRVFCTSRFSYTARFRNTMRMPVGIAPELFSPHQAPRMPQSVVYLGRIAPSKNLLFVVNTLGEMVPRFPELSCTLYGPAAQEDQDYLNELKERARGYGLALSIHEPISYRLVAEELARFEVLINASPDGMYDKVLFEASAVGTLVLSSNSDFAAQAPAPCSFRFNDASDCMEKLATLLTLPLEKKDEIRTQLITLATHEHGLPRLAELLGSEFAYHHGS